MALGQLHVKGAVVSSPPPVKLSGWEAPKVRASSTSSSWHRLCVISRETFDEVEGLSDKERCPLEGRSQAGDCLF